MSLLLFCMRGEGSKYISNTYNHIPTASFKLTIRFSSITAGLLSQMLEWIKQTGSEKMHLSSCFQMIKK